MRAIVVPRFGGAEVLELVETTRPDVKGSQVLIRVTATSVNFADIKSRGGQYHAAGTPPFIPGLDAAGVIEAVGPDVQHLSAGQRVIAFPKTGSYAEYIIAEEALTYVLPAAVSDIDAAACPLVSLTSYQLLAAVARITPGETVLIHAAAGGIGTTAAQIAKLLGAGLVIGTVGHTDKFPAALGAGCDHVLCYTGRDFASEVNALTGGRGADVILDSVAGTVTAQSFACLASYGRLVNFGNASGQPGVVLTTDLHASCRQVLGYSLGTTRNLHPEQLQGPAKKVLGFMASGQLTMNVGRIFALEDACAAQSWVEERHSTGKVVIDVALEH